MWKWLRTLGVESLPEGYSIVAVPRLNRPMKEDVYAIEPGGRCWRSYREYLQKKTEGKDVDGEEDEDEDRERAEGVHAAHPRHYGTIGQ